MKKDLHSVISIRLFTDQKCFGPGIAELMHRVDEHHSLRAAAKSMKMAYSKAWSIMKNSEKELGIKLLLLSTGGVSGGGASLTDEGRRILEAYDLYCEKMRACGDQIFSEVFGDLF